MTSTTYCSACGEKMKTAGSAFSWLVVVCSRCQKSSPTKFVALLGLLSLGLFAGFFIGRLTTPRPSFQFLGTPVDLQSARQMASSEPHEATADHHPAQNNPQSTGVAPADAQEVLTECGAPTRAGHPCRRKVRGGGYCYQHKDKVKPGASSNTPPASNEAARASQ